MQIIALGSHATAQFNTSDGTPVSLRRLRASDADRLVDLYDHLSEHSRLMRFNRDLASVERQQIEAEAGRLAAVESAQGMAWLALSDLPDDPDSPVGVVRILFVPPDGAEVALTVRDDMQRRGIAGQMAKFLIAIAPSLGIRHLYGLMRADNEAVHALIRSLALPITVRGNGDTLYLDLDLHRLHHQQALIA